MSILRIIPSSRSSKILRIRASLIFENTRGIQRVIAFVNNNADDDDDDDDDEAIVFCNCYHFLFVFKKINFFFFY